MDQNIWRINRREINPINVEQGAKCC